MIAELVQGKTQKEAGRVAGVSERTVRRRVQDPVFMRRVSDEQAALAAAAASQLAGLFTKAVDTLEDCLDDPKGAVRNRAAQLILALGPDFADRVAANAERAESQAPWSPTSTP